MQMYQGLTKKAQLWIAFLFLLLFVVVASYASLLYGQYKVERQIAQFREENARIARQNREKWIALVRLSLPRVIEKENKANLNRVRPGERVIVINDDESKNFVLKEQRAVAAAAVRSGSDPYPEAHNPRRWWYYFFPPSIALPAPDANVVAPNQAP